MQLRGRRLCSAALLSKIPAAATLAACFLVGLLPSVASADPQKLTVVVLVVDSLMPDELGQSFPYTPNLTLLRDSGTSYSHSRAVFSAETIPNHVAMMTGMMPEHSGIPGNSYWDRTGTPAARDLSRPSELEAKTLFTRIHESCPGVRTAAALSKSYLYEIFSACGYSGSDCGINDAPDRSFDPKADPTFIPQSNHTPDQTTMREARGLLPDADFLFINLGDTDRVGHIDVTGNSGTPMARYAALMDTDVLVGQLLDDLDASGRWDSTVMLVVSDHGMDWSTPMNFVNLTPDLAPGLFAVQNGGTGSIFVVDPGDPEKEQKLASARAIALMQEGVDAAWYREPNSLDPGEDTLIPASLGARHENIGDLVIVAKQGWRISDPSQTSNPLPGNHGHMVTFHNTFIVTGGLTALRTQTVGDPSAVVDPMLRLPEQSENTDVAPTVAWLLGMDAGDMDGRALTEAFQTGIPPSVCGVIADSDGDGEPDYRDPCPFVAGAGGCICSPQPATDCRQTTHPAASHLSINRTAGDAPASLRFTWKDGEQSSLADFHNPSDEALSLCLYSEASAWPRSLGELRMPFDLACGDASCWNFTSPTKLRLTNPTGNPDGVEKALLTAGADGQARISIKAQTSSIAALPLAAPLRVQLQSRGGACWEAAFDESGVRQNENGRFDAVSGN
jgi:hypothetical protein